MNDKMSGNNVAVREYCLGRARGARSDIHAPTMYMPHLLLFSLYVNAAHTTMTMFIFTKNVFDKQRMH